MKDFKDIKVIGIDHGYGNIKTANTVTPTGITAYNTQPIFAGGILEFEDKYYRIGEGHKEFIPDKAEDNDNYLLTLMAIARELHIAGENEATVHIAAGLPLTWIKRDKDSFRAYLMQREEVNFIYESKPYHIRFAGCSIYPQGYPAIIDVLPDFKGTNLLCDIGNGTMNLLYFRDKKPQETRCWTEKIGVNQCMIMAKNAVMDKTGINIDEGNIEHILRFKSADISEKYLSIITEEASRYVEALFSTLRKYEYNPDLMRLYVVGGGGCLVKNFGIYDESRVTIIDDICATAKGYEKLAYLALRREAKNEQH